MERVRCEAILRPWSGDGASIVGVVRLEEAGATGGGAGGSTLISGHVVGLTPGEHGLRVLTWADGPPEVAIYNPSAAPIGKWTLGPHPQPASRATTHGWADEPLTPTPASVRAAQVPGTTQNEQWAGWATSPPTRVGLRGSRSLTAACTCRAPGP
jgi:hypothetical protein